MPLLMVKILHVSFFFFFFFFVALLNLLFRKIDSLYSIDTGMDFNLGETMDSLAEWCHESDDNPHHVPLKRKKTCDWGAQLPTVDEAPQLLDDPIEVVSSPVDVGIA